MKYNIIPTILLLVSAALLLWKTVTPTPKADLDQWKRAAFNAVCEAWSAGHTCAESEHLGTTNLECYKRISFSSISNDFHRAFFGPPPPPL